MFTCTKRYVDIPFAHRQPRHAGHCRYVHGHNWSFEFEFAAVERDECGFVVDFGKLGPLRDKLMELDHALVLNADDPHLRFLQMLEGGTADQRGESVKLARVVVVNDCSCEGMAHWAFVIANDIVKELTEGRAWVRRVTCFEDSRNSATFDPEPLKLGIAGL